MAQISPLRFRGGDTLFLRTTQADRQMFTVVRSTRDGYLLRSYDEADDRTWSHDEINAVYMDGFLEHYPANLAAMNAKLAEVIQSDWESWRPELRFQAECRLEYCTYVERLTCRGVRVKVARRRSARTVFRRFYDRWLQQANRLAGWYDHLASERRHRRRNVLRDGEIVRLEQPSEFAVRDWHVAWLGGGKDVRALLPRFHDRGNRKPRKTCKLHLQEHVDLPLCVYGAMRFIARKLYMREPRPPRSFAHRELTKFCERHGLESISYQGFCKFLDRHYTEFEEFKARHGSKAAYLRFHLFRRREAPEVPLSEVEVDHTLLDIFVRDAQGRVGRPWLTLLICRATRCIVGLHISFDVPSYATLGRAVLHAICPKDLSGIEGLKHRWPCHGVPVCIITDRGLEFMSESFLRAGKMVGFAVVNLPGRCPHLKGAVERFFGTLNIRVLSHLEGTTLSRSVETYNPELRAALTLDELIGDIIRWIVNDYHQERHPSIAERPAVRWNVQSAKFGVRPIPSFRMLITMLGEVVKRKIGNLGVEFENHTYASAELEELRGRRGGLQKDWEIRIDPYDRGEIWVLDEQQRRWITVPALHQKTTRGVSKYQSRWHNRIARQLVPKGEDVTEADIEQAMEVCAAKALTIPSRQAQRYLADGSLATPVLGYPTFAVVPSADVLGDPQKALPFGEAPLPQLISEDAPQAPAATTSFGALLAARLMQESLAA